MNRRRSWGQGRSNRFLIATFLIAKFLFINPFNVLNDLCLKDDNGRQRKRRRQDSEPPLPLEDKLESLIVRIGEKNSSPLEKNLEDLSQILNEDSVRYKSNIVKIICEWSVDCIY